MKWCNAFFFNRISRNEDKSSSRFHFFTSHFYSTLVKKTAGPKQVMSWTAKKKINIFEKKFIFIPINKDLHWSLCVVVNPGAIENACKADRQNLPVPCLIFMDSLNLHRKETVRRNIMRWLNAEWERFKEKEVKEEKEEEQALVKYDRNNFIAHSPGGTCLCCILVLQWNSIGAYYFLLLLHLLSFFY